MQIPVNVKNSLNASLKQRRIVLATSSKDGIPNTVPLGIMKFMDDETIILMDNNFLKTRANLEKNPWVALTGWNMEEKEGKLVAIDGFQVKGKAKIEATGELYEKVKAEYRAVNPNYPARAIVILKVEEIYDVKSGANAGRKVQ